METINEKLMKLYSSKWNNLTTELLKIERNNKNNDNYTGWTNPVLISIQDEERFIKADLRIMFFGQEAHTWFNDEIPIRDYSNTDVSINKLLARYRQFTYEENGGGLNTPFWKQLREFTRRIKEKFPEKNIEFVYNNVVKIGKEEGMGLPDEEIFQSYMNCFCVIPEEIKIIKPNVCIFFTGPYYDWIIRDIFGNIQYKTIVSSFSESELAQFPIPNIDFSFRTYHPGYLSRYPDYKERIIKEIIEQIKI